MVHATTILHIISASSIFYLHIGCCDGGERIDRVKQHNHKGHTHHHHQPKRSQSGSVLRDEQIVQDKE